MTTQWDVFLYGLAYVLVSLVMGTATLFICFKLFNLLTRKIDDMAELKANNIAVALINAAIVFSVALFISEAADTAMEAFKNTVFNYAYVTTLRYKLTIYGIMVLHFVLAGVISFVTLWISIMIFTRLTKTIDEFAEIKKNNQAVGIFLSVFIVSMALILKPGVGKLLKGFVPFPEASGTPKVTSCLHSGNERGMTAAPDADVQSKL